MAATAAVAATAIVYHRVISHTIAYIVVRVCVFVCGTRYLSPAFVRGMRMAFSLKHNCIALLVSLCIMTFL